MTMSCQLPYVSVEGLVELEVDEEAEGKEAAGGPAVGGCGGNPAFVLTPAAC